MQSKFPWKALAISGAALAAIRLALYARDSKPKTTTSTKKRIALIGDSYAVGLGPELEKLIPNFRYEGHEGTNTSQWAHSVAVSCGQCGSWLTAYKPDVVLVALGVNDGATPNVKDYQTIARNLHGIGAKTVWIEPPDGVRASATRTAITSLGVPTVRTSSPLAADDLHPQQYGPWAREIVEAVRHA